MLDQLKLLIRSENPIIALETRDEDKAVDLVRTAATEMALPLFEWAVTTGMRRTKPTPADTGVKAGKAGQALDYILDNKGDPEIYLFRDLGPHAKDPVVQRGLRDLCGKHGLTLVLIDGDPLPEGVRRLAVPLKLPLSDETELEKVVRDTFHDIKTHSLYEITCSLTKRDMETLVQTLRGLTAHEAARVVASAVHDDHALTAADLPRVIEAKRNLLQGTGCQEAIGVNVAADEIGGLDRL
jgi:hypothetical protein